jgi:hypothetical protein
LNSWPSASTSAPIASNRAISASVTTASTSMPVGTRVTAPERSNPASLTASSIFEPSTWIRTVLTGSGTSSGDRSLCAPAGLTSTKTLATNASTARRMRERTIGSPSPPIPRG